MSAEITAIGNEGFRIVTATARIFIDAFYATVPGVAEAPALRPSQVAAGDLILVTHSHWDHFDPRGVSEAAVRSGAKVVGPQSVIQTIQANLKPDAVVELEPPLARGRGPAASATARLPAATVTAFRTFHSDDHNSYLVETPGCRFFHDGDNEETQRIDAAALGRLDALFIGPWRGSGWVDFIERLAPARWFLMHLTGDELDQHEAGSFLPDLCDHVPPGLVVLRPGQSFTL